MNTTTLDPLLPSGRLVAPPGLKGLIVADTTVGSVRGAEGFYHYRDHDAVELARGRSLEDVWHLLWWGRLPTTDEGIEFRQRVAQGRLVPPEALELVDRLAERVSSPHHLLQASLPLVRPEARATLDLSHEDRRDDALALVAAAPTLLARGLSGRLGQDLAHGRCGPDPAAGHAADWLAMLTVGAQTDDREVQALERYLVATIDHGFNASTFGTRVVASTGADVVAALSAGVGALSGPLHGGAPARALSMIREIGHPDRAADWVDEQLARGDKIMGFGHAVYRAGDPRSELMKETARWWDDPIVSTAIEIEAGVLESLRRHKPDAAIVTNVEYYAGVVLHLAGVPAEAFTSCFTVSRMIGWGAHLLEQAADNKILRPSARYVGPPPPGNHGRSA